MRQLDYRPNFTASSLRRAGGRTKAIAAILEDVGNPFSAAVLRALEDTAREQGVLIIAGSIDEDPAREQELVRAFVARRADALVIAPASHSQAYLNAELASGTPIVVVDRAPVGIATDAVLVDNHGGARRAVEHLLAGGHRRIGYLGDLQTIATARLRFAGYADALRRAGVEVDPRLVVHDLHNESAAHDAALDLLAAPLAPTALFTAQNNVTDRCGPRHPRARHPAPRRPGRVRRHPARRRAQPGDLGDRPGPDARSGGSPPRSPSAASPVTGRHPRPWWCPPTCACAARASCPPEPPSSGVVVAVGGAQHERRREHDVVGRGLGRLDRVEQHGCGARGHLEQGVVHGGEAERRPRRHVDVVEADDCELVGHAADRARPPR